MIDRYRGTWVAQSVECLTLDCGSGHDPRVVGSSPTLGSTLSVEPSPHTLSLSPSPSPSATLPLNKIDDR